MGFTAAGSEILVRQEIEDITDASPLSISLEGKYGMSGGMAISGFNLHHFNTTSTALEAISDDLLNMKAW